jgi:guanyl-specific ribonuclease Sa
LVLRHGLYFLFKETIMAMDNTAAKAAKLREMAKDKSLPQDVRNTYLDEAVKIEEKAATKAGVKLAKGGAVAKALPKRGQRTATNMAKGGSVAKKAKGK